MPASRAACVPRLHADADIGLRQRRRVIGAVAAHGDQPSLRLFAADVAQLVLGRGLGDEIVDAGFRGDRRRRHRIVAGDHHGLDAHAAQRGEAILHVRLDDILQVDHAEDAAAIGEAKRRAAGARDLVDRGAECRRLGNAAAGLFARELEHGIDRALAQLAGADIDAGQPRHRRERDELGAGRRHLTPNIIFFLHQRDDRAAFRGFVGIAGKQCGFRGFAFAHARHHNDFSRQPVAEGDGAGLVEQQRIDVAGRFHRAAGHRQHVEAHQPIHAGNADGREQRADGGRDQRHEQRHQNNDRDRAAGISRVARNGRGREHEDDGQADQQDVQRDLVRRLLPFGAFDQLDHAIEERRAGRGRDANHDAVGNNRGAAGHRRAVAAGFADHRRGFAGNGGLVDRGDALDHFAVAGNDVAGLAYHQIASLQVFGRHAFIDLVIVRHQDALGARLGAGFAQTIGLRLAAPFRHRFGEVREQHGEPQPQDDLEGEPNARVMLDDVAHEQEQWSAR